MTLPGPESNDHRRRASGCVVYTYDGRTGTCKVQHLAERPAVLVQLDDGTRLTLEEYQVREEAGTLPRDEACSRDDVGPNLDTDRHNP